MPHTVRALRDVKAVEGVSTVAMSIVSCAKETDVVIFSDSNLTMKTCECFRGSVLSLSPAAARSTSRVYDHVKP